MVAWAASNGDRSENADYLYGKKRLREIDKRLRFLAQRMQDAEVVDPILQKGNKVVFGCFVTIEDEEGQLHEYQIVGQDEGDVKLNRISWKSPLARALLGKKVEDAVVVPRPQGTVEVTIVGLRFAKES